MSKLRVYIASNVDQARLVDECVAPPLVARGCEIVSTWHNGPPYPTEDLEALTEEAAFRIRDRNMRDLGRAHVCLVLSTHKGGEHHAEAAIAHKEGLTLVWVDRLILLAKQPGVLRRGSLAEAVDTIAEIAKRKGRPSWMPRAAAGGER